MTPFFWGGGDTPTFSPVYAHTPINPVDVCHESPQIYDQLDRLVSVVTSQAAVSHEQEPDVKRGRKIALLTFLITVIKADQENIWSHKAFPDQGIRPTIVRASESVHGLSPVEQARGHESPVFKPHLQVTHTDESAVLGRPHQMASPDANSTYVFFFSEFEPMVLTIQLHCKEVSGRFCSISGSGGEAAQDIGKDNASNHRRAGDNFTSM